ncbi:unnamed protein product [Pleuronectes platessa]|uniref:Ubiquitin-conjugating enzyme E2 G2 n=1 Tax=Pleuronectes platessa TaxID=8262 RepID=A0A9N7U3N5_PLEPL|nr:unnamed protein product [Pleuronectes platessa]
MAGTALKRLMAEYKQLTLNPPEGIVAGPANEENFFEWEALIMGPQDTCFEGGVFPALLSFPSDYPLSPPKMRFTCDMFHPNIYPDGRVCISILHAPGDDPMGYESSAERWSPVQSVEKILLSVVSMLAEPNDESGANVDASKMWREDREQFYKLAQKINRCHVTSGSSSPVDEAKCRNLLEMNLENQNQLESVAPSTGFLQQHVCYRDEFVISQKETVILSVTKQPSAEETTYFLLNT